MKIGTEEDRKTRRSLRASIVTEIGTLGIQKYSLRITNPKEGSFVIEISRLRVDVAKSLTLNVQITSERDIFETTRLFRELAPHILK